jgi:hypothetical protein
MLWQSGMENTIYRRDEYREVGSGMWGCRGATTSIRYNKQQFGVGNKGYELDIIAGSGQQLSSGTAASLFNSISLTCHERIAECHLSHIAMPHTEKNCETNLGNKLFVCWHLELIAYELSTKTLLRVNDDVFSRHSLILPSMPL